MPVKLDILAFGAHPDDVELSCGGTLYKYSLSGKKVCIIDLTRGELGTRGTVALRLKEAEAARKKLGAAIRENLKMEDGFFLHNKKNILKVVTKIRQYSPAIVLCNAPFDRHPDHGRAARLVNDACFLAGLAKLETRINGKKQQAFRPQAVYHYIQFKFIRPDYIVDISSCYDKKIEAIRCFASQFYSPGSKEPETFISKPDFITGHVERRALDMGKLAKVKYGEGYIEANASEASHFLL